MRSNAFWWSESSIDTSWKDPVKSTSAKRGHVWTLYSNDAASSGAEEVFGGLSSPFRFPLKETRQYKIIMVFCLKNYTLLRFQFHLFVTIILHSGKPIICFGTTLLVVYIIILSTLLVQIYGTQYAQSSISSVQTKVV
jgi:hypothetical protein